MKKKRKMDPEIVRKDRKTAVIISLITTFAFVGITAYLLAIAASQNNLWWYVSIALVSLLYIPFLITVTALAYTRADAYNKIAPDDSHRLNKIE